MFALPRRYDSYEEYQHERLKREEYRRDYEKRESERAEQREKQRQKAIVSATTRVITPSQQSATSGFYYHQISNQLKSSQLLISCRTLHSWV